MRYVAEAPAALAGGPKLSTLGFGCAALLGRVGRKDSLRALAGASDAGITFFDTARSYGYGESERLLGEFLRGRRHQAIICTKFGIAAARPGWKQKVKPLAQAAIGLFPSLRSFARQHAAGEIAAPQFSVAALHASFETSLRELGTDYVDLLLLHGATAAVLNQDDLLDALERLVDAGKVRMAGISGDHAAISETFRRKPSQLTTAQFAMNPANFGLAGETLEASRRMFLVANHPFGGPAGVGELLARVRALAEDVSLPADLRQKLAQQDRRLMPEIVFGCILEGTGVAAIVPAMMKAENLRDNVAAVEHCRFTPDELNLLRSVLATSETDTHPIQV